VRLIVLMLLAIPVACFAAGVAIGRSTRPKDPKVIAYHEHARLIELAAKASKRGQDGLAEIHMQAARNVLDPPFRGELGWPPHDDSAPQQ
jgi:hypothetical protein